MTIKAQANFISKATREKVLPKESRQPEDKPWVLMTDGSATIRASGAGCILFPPEGKPLKYALVLTFPATDEAEYEALIASLLIVKEARVTNLHVECDSQLVVNQVLEECEAREECLVTYTERAKALHADFPQYKIEPVPR
ncbi:hypothetical protein CRG98_023843 [Punica granatum]|uniref:RNase H type-1 domain-containing protein n=1 Tax=Punica granatum TaxID=22663 RepID=A0A2I0JHN0_PUNGR|nr:hypothetical protein CRG98_023843 [Punica granatum]